MIRSAVLVLTMVFAAPAAAKADYLGAWTIAGAEPAPWVSTTVADEDKLVGRSIRFEKSAIVASAPLGCAGPRYKMRSTVAAGLFQGNLTAPAEQAAKLGFKTSGIRTLQTGCEGFIDFHFVDDGTAMFALNNLIYTIRRP